MQTEMTIGDQPKPEQPKRGPRDDLYCVHSRERFKLSDTWNIYHWEVFPKGQDRYIYYQFTGMVAPPKKGKPGQYAWRRGDKSTERTVVITIDEHKAWLIEWERKTGKCHECQGSKEVMASCGVNGITYRTCPRCKGTGEPPIAEVSK